MKAFQLGQRVEHISHGGPLSFRGLVGSIVRIDRIRGHESLSVTCENSKLTMRTRSSNFFHRSEKQPIKTIPAFKIGDKVKYVGPSIGLKGMKANIVSIEHVQNRIYLHVKDIPYGRITPYGIIASDFKLISAQPEAYKKGERAEYQGNIDEYKGRTGTIGEEVKNIYPPRIAFSFDYGDSYVFPLLKDLKPTDTKAPPCYAEKLQANLGSIEQAELTLDIRKKENKDLLKCEHAHYQEGQFLLSGGPLNHTEAEELRDYLTKMLSQKGVV